MSLPSASTSARARCLVPIETPLVAAGLYPETLARFGKDFSSWGMTVMAGGTAAAVARGRATQARRHGRNRSGPRRSFAQLGLHGDDRRRKPHSGLRASAFWIWRARMPLSRAHVLMTLASAPASTKIITTSGTIGTLTQDRQTAVMGTLGRRAPDDSRRRDARDCRPRTRNTTSK